VNLVKPHKLLHNLFVYHKCSLFRDVDFDSLNRFQWHKPTMTVRCGPGRFHTLRESRDADPSLSVHSF
jgi:hypothetical protein